MRILYQEYRAANAGTKFPFAQIATLTNDEAIFIDIGLFVDASLYPIGGHEGLRLSLVNINGTTATLYVGDNTTEQLASGELSLLGDQDAIEMFDIYGRPAGLILVDPTQVGLFQSWGDGDHVFTRQQTEFAAVCYYPTPEKGIRGFLLENGEAIYGDVVFVGKDGYQLQVSDETIDVPGEGSVTYPTITFNVTGDPLFRRRACEAEVAANFTTPSVIKQLTFKKGAESFVCYPNEFGAIAITVGNYSASDTVLRVKVNAEGLTIDAVGSSVSGKP